MEESDCPYIFSIFQVKRRNDDEVSKRIRVRWKMGHWDNKRTSSFEKQIKGMFYHLLYP